MLSHLNNLTLASILDECFTANETKWVVFCDEGSGCGFGPAGRAVEYDPGTMAHLIMADLPEGEGHRSDDGVDTVTQSAWQGDGGHRWQIRF